MKIDRAALDDARQKCASGFVERSRDENLLKAYLGHPNVKNVEWSRGVNDANSAVRAYLAAMLKGLRFKPEVDRG